MADPVLEKLDRLEKLIIEMKEGNDEKFAGFNKRFAQIDESFFEIDRKFETVVDKLLEHENQLKNIEENMVTKIDIHKIWIILDTLSESSEKHGTELLCINESIRRIEIKLEDHDKILR